MSRDFDNKIQVLKILREKRDPRVAGLEPEIEEKEDESKERNMLKLIGHLVEKVQKMESDS